MAPILLSRDAGTNSPDNVFKNFSFVGFAFKKGESLAWPAVFVNSVPTDNMVVAYAQCQVYNEFSPNDRRSGWNTFSQNWRSRLVRMDHWEWALDKINTGFPAEATVAPQQIGANWITPVQKMLSMYAPEDVDLITH